MNEPTFRTRLFHVALQNVDTFCQLWYINIELSTHKIKCKYLDIQSLLRISGFNPDRRSIKSHRKDWSAAVEGPVGKNKAISPGGGDREGEILKLTDGL